MKSVLAGVFSVLVASAAAVAAERTPALTIYNQDFAVVRELVPLDLAAVRHGRTRVIVCCGHHHVGAGEAETRRGATVVLVTEKLMDRDHTQPDVRRESRLDLQLARRGLDPDLLAVPDPDA